MQHVLRPFWQKIFPFNWKFGLLLVIIVCVPRFILVLYANTTGSYGSIGIIMLVSALVPFIFLNKYGRQKIGIKKPGNYSWLLAAFAAGIAFSLLLYFLGTDLYNDSYENWYKYIGKSYKIPAEISPADRSTLFIVVAITGMIFSPIGEELFFRGIVHSAFAASVGNGKASMADSFSFCPYAYFTFWAGICFRQLELLCNACYNLGFINVRGEHHVFLFQKIFGFSTRGYCMPCRIQSWDDLFDILSALILSALTGLL